MGKPERIEEFLAPYPPHVIKTMLEGRQRLLAILQPVIELHYDATSAVCIGFSYLPSQKGLFVNLAAYANHVTLVFAHGSKLIDPAGILSGGGSQVRHRRLAGVQDLSDPRILALIEQASHSAPRPEGIVEHQIIEKVYEGPKRRPVS